MYVASQSECPRGQGSPLTFARWRHVRSIGVALALVLATSNAWAQPTNPSFESGLAAWTPTGDVTVIDATFGAGLSNGAHAARLGNGPTAAETDVAEAALGVAPGTLSSLGDGSAGRASVLQQSCSVVAGERYAFDWSFLTDEPLASPNNDFALVRIHTDVPLVIADTNTLPSLDSASVLQRETGFQSFCFTAPITGMMSLAFGVVDASDAATPSALLIDNLRIVADSDGDGVSDPCDRCPGHDDNLDIDGDGVPDDCDFDDLVGYKVGLPNKDGDGEPIENKLPRNFNVVLNSLHIDDASPDDPEHFELRKTTGVLNPAENLHGALGPFAPARKYVRYQARPGKQSIAPPTGTRFSRPARHVKRLWQLENRFGKIIVQSQKVEAVLLPAATDPTAPTSPLANDTPFLCYKIKPTTDITDQTPPSRAGSRKGKFSKELQAFAGDVFADCATAVDDSPSFNGSPVQGTCLFNLKKVKELCLPADMSEVQLPHFTTASITPSVAATSQGLLCYQAVLARRVVSEDAAALGNLPHGAIVSPAQRKHLRRRVADGNPLHVAPSAQVPAPVLLNTVQADRVCVQSEILGVSGDEEFLPTPDVDGPSVVFSSLPVVIRNGQNLTATGTSDPSGVGSVEYRYCAGADCTPSILIGSNASGPDYHVAWNGQPSDGTYQVTATATDTFGNPTTSAKQTVVIDNTAPTANATSPTAGSIHSSSGTIYIGAPNHPDESVWGDAIAGTASDSTSGVDSVQISLRPSGGNY